MKKGIKRINYLKLITKIISYLPFVLLITIIGVIIYIIIHYFNYFFAFIDATKSNIVVAIISAVTDLIIVTGLTALPRIRKSITKFACEIETSLYRLISNKSFLTPWVKSFFINILFSKSILPYKSQSNIIRDYIQNLDNDQNHLFYIIGDDNCGKTTVIMFLLDQCLNRADLYKRVNKHTIYLCKFYSDMQIEEFVKDYMLGKYKNKYIFIDDIGDMSLISQIKLWNHVINPVVSLNSYNAKVVTIISNRNNPYINNRINDVTQSCYVVDYIKKEITNKCFSNDSNIFFKEYNINNDLIKEMFNNMIQYSGINSARCLMEDKCNELQSLCICLTIASRYSKLVDIKIIKQIFKHLGYTSICFYKNTHLLINAKIISIFPFLKNCIYIDSYVTEFFLLYYRKTKVYSKILSFFDNKVISNVAERWLNDCEKALALNTDYSKQSFVSAFNMGNYNFLLDNLNKIILSMRNYYHDFSMELGYLNEKVGNREKAINNLSYFINNTEDTFEKQSSYLLLFEITHHYNFDTSKIAELSKSNDEFINLQAQYWIEHINIEKGIFNYDELYAIVNKYLKIENKNQINYYHVLRRMFSDLARVYYLNGKIDILLFNKFRENFESSGLNIHHPEYNEFYSLLVKAHYLHYDVIFQLGFYKSLIHNCDNEYGNNPKIDKILDIALEEYSKCKCNFEKYGDKAWITVSIRQSELMLCSNTQIIKILSNLNDLKESFKNNKNDLHLAFIDCIICKAEFLNYYINFPEHKYEKPIQNCMNLLNESLEIYKRLKNNYGIFRINFIRAFIDFFADLQSLEYYRAIDNFRNNIKKLKNKDYSREKEMIDFILEMNEIPTDLICRFFKFYPIILQ